MKIPEADEKTAEFFKSIVPNDSRVVLRPMFGNLSAFVNGNMFSGVFGEDLFVRLSEDDRVDLLKNKGTSAFAPMAGRPMKEYIVLPREWVKQPGRSKIWINRALEWTAKMPPKKTTRK